MIKLSLFVYVLFIGSTILKAQTYQEIVQMYPNSFGSYILEPNTSIYESPELKSGTIRTLPFKAFILVYDSLDIFYKVATPQKGHIGFIQKSFVAKKGNYEQIQSIGLNTDKNNSSEIKVKMENFIISGIAFVLMYEFLSSADDTQKSIDYFNEVSNKTGIEFDLGYLEKQRDRWNVFGYSMGMLGFTSIVLAFERVEIKSSINSVSLNYKYNF